MTEGDRSPSADEASLSNVGASEAPEPGGAVALVVVCGLPGVGKSTVAERVAAHVDGDVLRTDVIRKELFDEPTYSESETEAVYAELIRRARDRVGAGTSVVLDATFANARFRDDVRGVGSRVADAFALMEVVCDEPVVERRIERRDGISDADFEIHLHIKELFDRIERDHVVVDNSGDEAATFAQVDAAFGSSDALAGAAFGESNVPVSGSSAKSADFDVFDHSTDFDTGAPDVDAPDVDAPDTGAPDVDALDAETVETDRDGEEDVTGTGRQLNASTAPRE